MRRGEVAKVMYHLDDFGDVCVLFRNYALTIAEKAQVGGHYRPVGTSVQARRVGMLMLPTIPM